MRLRFIKWLWNHEILQGPHRANVFCDLRILLNNYEHVNSFIDNVIDFLTEDNLETLLLYSIRQINIRAVRRCQRFLGILKLQRYHFQALDHLYRLPIRETSNVLLYGMSESVPAIIRRCRLTYRELFFYSLQDELSSVMDDSLYKALTPIDEYSISYYDCPSLKMILNEYQLRR